MNSKLKTGVERNHWEDREKAIGLDASKVSLLKVTQGRTENKPALATKGRGEESPSQQQKGEVIGIHVLLEDWIPHSPGWS